MTISPLALTMAVPLATQGGKAATFALTVLGVRTQVQVRT